MLVLLVFTETHRIRFAPKPIVSAEDLKILFMEVEALHAANQKVLILLGAFPNPRTSLSLTEIFFNLCNFLKVLLISLVLAFAQPTH